MCSPGPREPPPSCPELSQRIGTHPPTRNGNSCRPGRSPNLSQLHCQVSSRLQVAAASTVVSKAIHPGPVPIRDIPQLTSRFQSLTDPLRSPGTPAERVGSRLSLTETYLASDFSRHQIYTNYVAAQISTTTRNHDTRPTLRTPLWLQSTCMHASGRRDRVHLRLAAFQRWPGCAGRGPENWRPEATSMPPVRRQGPTCGPVVGQTAWNATARQYPGWPTQRCLLPVDSG
jgi:hypothetical protein